MTQSLCVARASAPPPAPGLLVCVSDTCGHGGEHMAAAVTDEQMMPDRGLAQELLGDMAELLNNTRPLMLADSVLLAGLTLGLVLDTAILPAPHGTLAILGG